MDDGAHSRPRRTLAKSTVASSVCVGRGGGGANKQPHTTWLDQASGSDTAISRHDAYECLVFASPSPFKPACSGQWGFQYWGIKRVVSVL